jgi:aldehyde dehydrogenase (NAD+)
MMKTKLKPVKLSTKRAVAASTHAVVPLKERRLNFGDKWNYAPAPEDSKNYVIAPQHELFINGKFVAPTSGKYFESINPATEQTLTTIAAANEVDVDSAVKAARKAYDKVWSKMPGRERGKYLYRIARIIQEKSRELAVLETMDGGKTIKESRDVDLPLVAAHFFYYAGWADKLKYAFPGKTPSPLGVAGQIIPWNFPLLMAAWKIAPALACGNTVVLKPAETTSLTAMRLALIFQEAELPEGVVNIVTGAGETGAALVNHPDINKLAFTGSTEVGKRIAQAVAGSKKKLTLELGGKAANILFEDAPIDQASKASSTESISTRATFVARGHGCSCRKGFIPRSSRSCATASRRCASAIRSTRTPTSARSIRGRSSKKFANWCKAAWTKARS